MSNDRLNIPKKINVGYQNREDTYTGKLAFVVYTDDKGVLRKEKSWNGWRDKKIEPQEFDNVPTSGFVLNKKVGDYSSRWGGRKSWLRVYDPRDFEYEISVDNLVFILEECSAIKGKGLEGEFVYAWDGADLVLLPVGSLEYKQSSNFTVLQSKKVGKDDMKAGCVYKNKDNKEVMYLGRLNWTDIQWDWKTNKYNNAGKSEKRHVFVYIDSLDKTSNYGKEYWSKDLKYWTQSGFTKLAEKLTDDPSPLFADAFDSFMKSDNGSPPVKIVSKSIDLDKAKRDYRNAYIKKDDKFYKVEVRQEYRGGYSWNSNDRRFWKLYVSQKPTYLDSKLKLVTTKDSYYTDKGYDSEEISEQKLNNTEFFELYIENKEGNKLKI